MAGENKKKYLVIVIACLSLVSFFVITQLLSLNKGAATPGRIKNADQWTALLEKNKNEFAALAQDFLNQAEISELRYQNNYYTSPCDLEDFSLCSVRYLKSGSAGTDIYQNGEKLEVANQYSLFMAKYKIMFMNITDKPANSRNLEISSGDFGQCGLKYYPDGINHEVEADGEFTDIKKLDKNWYYFCKDWN